MSCRRIVHEFAVSNLFFIEALVILGSRISNCIMLRLVGLDDGFAGHIPSACSSCCLCQKLEGTFRCSVIIAA